MKKIGTIGEIVVEVMGLDPGEGFREPLRLSGPYPSGAPAIFIDQVARLGQPCAMIGRVGRDDFGTLNIERLRRDGVDVRAITVDPEAATGSAFVRYRTDGARDFVFNIRHSASGRLQPGPLVDEVIGGCDHLHVMGSSLFGPVLVDMTLAAIRTIRGRGGSVSFDPNVRKEMLDGPGMRAAFDAILAQADIFLPSGPELFLFAESGTEAEAARQVQERGVPWVVVKHGAEGARLYGPAPRPGGAAPRPGGAALFIDQRAFPATERDPTGAGDCFGATFVTAWLRGMPPSTALALATAAGARAVEQQGPMEGTSTLAELQAMLANRGAGR